MLTEFCSVEITKTKIGICKESIVLPLTFNQVKKQNTTQLKSKFHFVCYHHGLNQSRETRVQLLQYRFHQFQTDLDIFLCKD